LKAPNILPGGCVAEKSISLHVDHERKTVLLEQEREVSYNWRQRFFFGNGFETTSENGVPAFAEANLSHPTNCNVTNCNVFL
jgi:hypothetical protein